MKNMKKFASLLLALVMVFSLAATAFAQDINGTQAASGKGQITISNPAKGETYAIYKLFDATVSADGKSIAYTGSIPTDLSTYFTEDAAGNITATADAGSVDNMSDGLKDALKTWTKTADVVNQAVSDGTVLNFNNLDYGYYVVTTSQGEQLISVDSTKPTVTITDKNSTEPTPPTKEVDDNNVKFGDTATYTVKFKTANYNGDKKIVSYTIHDDLPEFLSDVTVTSIEVDGTAIATQQFSGDKKIVIPWVDEFDNHLYKNGAEVVITYTATVTDKAAVDGDGNTNTVTLTWDDEEGPVTPEEPENYKDSATIYTYALALKKVDPDGNALAGAEFQFPFYVKETKDTDGAYIYAGTTAGKDLTDKITTPDDGVIIVKGLEAGTPIEITETEAPAGYNKLTGKVTVTPTQTGKTTTETTVYLDAKGDVVNEDEKVTTVEFDLDIATTVVAVLNKTGTELPTTGGMGTTIFYVVGGVLVVAAGVLLITKKRMKADK